MIARKRARRSTSNIAGLSLARAATKRTAAKRTAAKRTAMLAMVMLALALLAAVNPATATPTLRTAAENLQDRLFLVERDIAAARVQLTALLAHMEGTPQPHPTSVRSGAQLAGIAGNRYSDAHAALARTAERLSENIENVRQQLRASGVDADRPAIHHASVMMRIEVNSIVWTIEELEAMRDAGQAAQPLARLLTALDYLGEACSTLGTAL